MICQLLPAVPPGGFEELLAVQRAAYTVEAELIGDDRIPQLYETLDELVRAPLNWFGAYVENHLVGAVAFTEDPDLVNIHRLFVAPSNFHSGIGRALAHHVLRHAGQRTTIVSTGQGNVPSRALYQKVGFAHVSDREVTAGLWISNYRHSPHEPSGFA